MCVRIIVHSCMSYTTQHRTVLVTFPRLSDFRSLLRCCLWEGTGAVLTVKFTQRIIAKPLMRYARRKAEIRKVFQARQKPSKENIGSRRLSGGEFQAIQPAMENAGRPKSGAMLY